MAEPLIGMIILFAGNFAPRNYAFCHGQVLPIAQNTALFSLLGTTYGGNGVTTFCLPDLRGRVPLHPGQGPGLSMYDLGQVGGVETVTLSEREIPAHNHGVQASSLPGNMSGPGNKFLAASQIAPPNASPLVYRDDTPDRLMDAAMITPTGGSQPHPNLQPYLAVNFIIALVGIYPSRN